MKAKLWLAQIPVILLFSSAFLVSELGLQGRLESHLLRKMIYPVLQRTHAVLTDFKFKTRGAVSPKNKIVIVEVDSQSLEVIGRWPWHRDAMAFLVERIFESGAKVVGLDVMFPEPDVRVPEDLAVHLKKSGLAKWVNQFETDSILGNVIKKYSDRLILGWSSELVCQPAFSSAADCPVAHPEALAALSPEFSKFSVRSFNMETGFKLDRTPLLSAATVISNIPSYEKAARHSGYLTAIMDVDGYIRRTALVTLVGGLPHPSLALEMARVGMARDLFAKIDSSLRLNELVLASRRLDVNSLGVMEINFRGPGFTFPYVSALDVMRDEDEIKDEVNRKLSGVSRREILKDAYVIIGVSALGVYDVRSFPFDSNVPGVEGHATILDNLLSFDSFTTGAKGHGAYLVLILMLLGVLAFAYFAEKLEAVPALLLFVLVFSGFAFLDIKIAFPHGQNWNSSYLYLELMTVFILTLAAKYVVEENKKKFIRSAFSKYLAPVVVDSILKDPSKLSLGGEKRDLTILFSDIRNFTTFSEPMDAKALAAFLNDYLSIMTGIVFDHRGTLDKYIGDAVMAFWGAPLDQPDHALNSCNAAIAMMKALRRNRDRLLQKYGIPVNIGIGINSGVVSVGNMGSDQNFEYTVIGDHVNLASRLEGLTKAYGVTILTTRFTLESIGKSGQPLPPHRTLDHVKVKGKKNAVEVIQILDQEYPPSALEDFEEGRVLYQNRKWEEALQKFLSANERMKAASIGEDGPSTIYLQRCKEFSRQPPPADWDGSWERREK